MEDQVFDYYDDLLQMGRKDKQIEVGRASDEIMRSNMPLVSRKAHRLFYMTDNTRSFKRGSRLIITPFLHERKIYHYEMEE